MGDAKPAGALPRVWESEEFRRRDEIFHGVHNLAFGAAEGLIWMQNHQGVCRSRDGGAVCEEVTRGLPSTFGFQVVAHAAKPGVARVVPLNGDSAWHQPVGARALVWKTNDGGATWAEITRHLPMLPSVEFMG